MYKIIGCQRHTMSLYTTLSSIKGYAKSIDIDKMYKITISEKKQGEPWKDKNGNIHPSGDVITADKIYEIENEISKDFPTCRVQDLKFKNVGLSKNEINEIIEKFKESCKISAAQ